MFVEGSPALVVPFLNDHDEWFWRSESDFSCEGRAALWRATMWRCCRIVVRLEEEDSNAVEARQHRGLREIRDRSR